MVLDPVVNFLQGHVAVLLAVDSKLDHSHVGIRGSLRQRVLLLFWSFGLLNRKQKLFLSMEFKKQSICCNETEAVTNLFIYIVA